MEMEVDKEMDRMKKDVYLMLAKIGDGVAGPSDVAAQISRAVERAVGGGDGGGAPHGNAYWEFFTKGLIRCGTELAHKVAMYAVVTGLIGVSAVAEGREVVERVANGCVTLLRQSIQEGNCARARRSMRFLCELGNSRALSSGWIIETLQSLVDAAVEDRRKGQLHRRASFLIDIAASALPWAARGLSEQLPSEFDSLVDDTLTTLQDICNEEEPQWSASLRYGHEDLFVFRLRHLQNALEDLKERDWTSSAIQHPEQIATFADKLREDGLELELSKMQIPSHSKIMRYSAPRFRFSLHGTSSARGSVNGSHKASTKSDDGGEDPSKAKDGVKRKDSRKHKGPAESFVLKELASDLLDNFRSKHVLVAGKLLTLPLPLDANQEVVEATFSDMCSLPRSPQPHMYYCAVFVDLCLFKDSRLPLKLLSAVETLYASAARIDPEVFDRITEWFSFHLSNFGFQWNWSDWAVCGATNAVERVPYQRLFCKDVLEHASRLSYRDLIRNAIPEDLHSLLPPDPLTLMNYLEDSPTVEKVLALISGVDRRPSGELRARLIGIIDEGGDRERLRCFTAAILRAGEKTLTHFDAVTERYLVLFRELVASTGEEGRFAVLDELWRIFPVAPVRLTYILDKLCTYTILDIVTVVRYLLSDHNRETKEAINRLESSNLWGIARLLIERQRSREHTANLEVSNAARAASLAIERDAEEASKRLETAKSTAQAVEQERTELVFGAFQQLAKLHAKFSSETASKSSASSLPTMPVWEWRVLGFCREVGRKNTDVLAKSMEDLGRLINGGDGEMTDAMRRELEAVRAIATADLTQIAR